MCKHHVQEIEDSCQCPPNEVTSVEVILLFMSRVWFAAAVFISCILQSFDVRSCYKRERASYISFNNFPRMDRAA